MDIFFDEDKVESKITGNALVVDGSIGGTLVSENLDTVGLVPGDSVEKTIAINPNCTTPSLLRVKVEPFWDGTNKDNRYLETKFDIEISQELENTEEPYWYKDSDGFLYYMDIINNNSEEINLVKGYSLTTGANVNEYQGKQIKINVELDIVQAKHGGYNGKWQVENEQLKIKLDELCGITQ